ncbi:opioid growth factor receptor-related protein [Vibrio ezurae]|uniref:Opioid growth factor receptor (OGFr) conserved domain-containing protein n=1 Tax=Vibrio ezurae NBRC 102218 TaxID=1219080 RepID=U3CLQ1_9VIBR|nr:opioid growth factor receptor-related protein [Vibrio ezurae]GAD79113.1 hypothetical protein VEZ01S_08_01490 [Vibrio ezurae NBRC 102218]
MNVLCRFMLGHHLDHKQRNIEQIWSLDDFWLQHDREYIQWLFPIDTPSKFQPLVPLVCSSTRDYFLTCKVLQKAQRRSLHIMLNFYDMQIKNGAVVPKNKLSIHEQSWLNDDDHSHRCITRIIRSLTLLGQQDLGRQFQEGMLDTAIKYGKTREESLNYWRNAHLL